MTRDAATLERVWERLVAAGEPLPGPADGLPAVCLNMVMSVDGAATIDGRVGRLTGPVDQALLRRLRFEADAVLVGAQTVRSEGYGRLLGDEARRERASGRGAEEPLLCVVSARLSLPFGSPALRPAPAPLVFLTSSPAPLPEAARPVAAIRSEDASPGGRLLLTPLLRRLREEHGVDRIICEGGPTLNTGLLAEGLVHDIFVALSPLMVQEPAALALTAGGAHPHPLRLVAHAAADDFVFLRYRVGG